jgi:hypothetical protein
MTSVHRASSAAAALALVLSACSGGGGGGGSGDRCTLAAASALEVVEAIPANGATGVSARAVVALRFNTCLALATVGPAVSLRTTAGPVPFSTAYDAATGTLTLHPAAPLAFSTTYFVMVLPTLRGASGEALTGWARTFRTRAAPELVPPTTTVAPAGGRYDHPLVITLACADDPGGTGCAGTYYTIDGRAPDGGAARYVEAIAIAETTSP